MHKVLIFSNRRKKGAQDVAAQMVAYLKERGIIAIYRYDSAGAPSSDEADGERLPDVDFAICIGGDGTALHLCRLLVGRQIPIVTINYGQLGFITEFSSDNWRGAIDHVLDGTYELEKRILIDVHVMSGGALLSAMSALNDAVLSVVGISKLNQYEVHIGDQLLAVYRADGLIVATPTGSTAYSVAAGGPILHPALTALIVNPICPFALAHRPIVIPTTEEVRIIPRYIDGVNTVLTVDGQRTLLLEDGQQVRIKMSDTMVSLVRSERYSFYEAIRQKLKWSGATHAQ